MMVIVVIMSYKLLKVAQLLLLLLDDGVQLPDALEVEHVRPDQDSHSVLHELLVQVLDVEDHGGVGEADLDVVRQDLVSVVDLVFESARQPKGGSLVPCCAL